MIGGLLAFALFAVLVPLLVGEAGDLAPFLAEWLLRWGARRIGGADQGKRYEEEWLADLEQVPGKVTKLAHAVSVVALSVPRMRVQFRRSLRRALLPGWLADPSAGQSARTAETDAVLQRVAETLVPDYADHCFIELLQGSALIRRAQKHAGGWTPPPGTWALTGDRIRYPEGHFCQRAMAQLNSVLIADLRGPEDSPPPSAPSLAAAQQVGLKSILAAPLYARGRLLGVISLAMSDLTGRSEHFTADDRDVIAAVAIRVSEIIDSPERSRSARQMRTRTSLSTQPDLGFPATIALRVN